MLYGVAAFVGGNGRRCHAAAVVHVAAKIDGQCGWVVMIGQLSFYLCYFHVVDAIVAQHFFRYLSARHSVA